MADYATIQDVITLFRPLTPEETERATALLPIVSDGLRVEAVKVGRDLDEMVEASTAYANVVKEVTVGIVGRMLTFDTSSTPYSQESQSALGYSWSGTYAVAGGGLQIMRNDLKTLGLTRQVLGVVNFDKRYNHYPL